MPSKDDLPKGIKKTGANTYGYRLPYKDASGKWKQEVRGGFLTWEDAWLRRTERAVAMGQAPASALPDNRTVGDYVTAYLEQHALEVDASTIYSYRGTAQRHIIPHLGPIRLKDLTVERTRNWIVTLTRERSAATAREARRLLSQILAQALEDELVTRNVVSAVRPPRHETRKPTILDGEQIAAFLRAADSDEWRAFWYVALMTQLRPGELAGLKWGDLDMDRGILHVNRTRSRNDQGSWVLGDGVKTPSSRRSFPLPSICVTVLKEHRREQNALRLRMPPGVWQDHDLVFPNTTGWVLSSSTMEYRLRQLCERAGVPVLTPHMLRHTGATWSRKLGEDPEVVAERLGHKDVTMTMNFYSHTLPDDQRRASERLESSLRDLRKQYG